MSLLVEAARSRRSRSPLTVGSLSLSVCAVTVGLSACAAWDAGPAPAPARAVPTAPVVIEAPRPLPAAVAASAPAAPLVERVEPATPADLVSRRLLAYHDQVRVLAPNDLASEIARLGALPPASGTSLELAIALMQTRNGGELNRAIGLVEPIARGGADELRPWQPIARWLVSRLLELRRLEDLLEKRSQELRDSQREVRQLNEKLEALKAIERSLAPRPSSSGSSPGLSGTASFAPASQPAAAQRRTP